MKRFCFFILMLFLGLYGYAQADGLNLRDIWMSRKFYPQVVKEMVSMKDGKHFLVLEAGEIQLYSYKTGEKVKSLVSYKDLIYNGDTLQIEEFQLSNDQSKVLIATNINPIYRHSYKADYFVLDLKFKKLTPLSKYKGQQIATFSPQGSKVAYMVENNLFVKDLNSGTEEQLTFDGKKNYVINGAPDWVYEEEFSYNKAYEWNSEGTQIAYVKFNESRVKEYNMQIWGDLYPIDYRFKYPKPGEENSIVSVHVYNITTKKTTNLDMGTNQDIYIPKIQFVGKSDVLSVLRLNRLQNQMHIIHWGSDMNKYDTIYTERNKRYIDLSNFYIYYLSDGNNMIITNETDGWNHIYNYNYKSKNLSLLTKGDYDVAEVKAVNETKGEVYYMSTEQSSLERQLYAYSYFKQQKRKITKEKGYHQVQFNADFSCYVDICSQANKPPKSVLCNYKGDLIRVLSENQQILKLMEMYSFVEKEFFTFTNDEGVKLMGSIMKPLLIESGKQYPVLMTFYGGPGSQEVADKWDNADYLWHQYMVKQGYIIVTVDGRGTGYRGEEFKKCTYGQLGNLELNDQIAVAKYLSQFSYVDKTRIGVWGWSFGGYLSTLCMTKGADYFKAGIAVAPVTNWRYYDNIYTERYMGLPQNNGSGYDENSPISHVSKLKGKYLLIHGTADDNVHIQNSFELMNELVKKNKQFEMQIYTNKNHGIYGGNTRYHLYQKITDFIQTNL